MLTREKERCETLGEFLVENKTTVRKAASHFKISKSTVHKDVTVHLRYVNPALYILVKEVLEQNKSERHLRGGEATRQKYLSQCGKMASKLVTK